VSDQRRHTNLTVPRENLRSTVSISDVDLVVDSEKKKKGVFSIVKDVVGVYGGGVGVGT